MSYRPLFTASRLDAVMRCLGASTLPHIEERPRDTAASEAGTVEHGRLLTDEGLPENLRDWLLDWDERAASITFEQPFVVDFSTVTARLSDGYGGVDRPTETGGTPDLFVYFTVGQENGRRRVYLRLPDLKTGEGQASGTLPSPSESWQLTYYALAVLLWLGWPDAADLGSCEVAWFTRDYEAEHDDEPEAAPDEREHKWRVTAASLSEERLLETLGQLCDLTVRLTSRPADTWRTGPWCERCTGFSACPVQQEPVKRLGIALERGVTAESIAQLHEAIGPVRRLLEQAEAVRDHFLACHGSLPTRYGYVLRRDKVLRRKPTRLALPVLRAAYPDEYAGMVRETVSIGSIARALGEKVPSAQTAAALDKLRAVPGALEETSSFVLRERRDGSE